MKKYTIKEFAEGKKAVKIEKREQWDKLNKVHRLCGYYKKNYYTNNEAYSKDETYLKLNSWEVIEFSQLDFEDKFVVGAWYKITDGTSKAIGEKCWYGKFQEINSTIVTCLEYIDSDGRLGENGKFGTIGTYTFTLLTDLSEIQAFLPFEHVDLIKKDTFVLPENWAIQITPENKAIVNEWKIKQIYNDDLFKNPSYNVVNNKGRGEFCKDFNDKRFITFEQFKTHILKEKTMEKEIIAYKLKFKEYEKAASIICKYTNGRLDKTDMLVDADFLVNSEDYRRLKEAGVLDLWFEAVFAPDKPKLPSINGKQCVDNGDKTITCGCTTESFDWILGVYYAMGNDIYISNTKVTQKEIKQIVEYINKK